MPYRVTFARLLGFLNPYKISLVVSTLLAIASQVAQIALVWVTAHVIDDAVIPRDAGKLWVYVWVIIGLGALRAAFMAARRLISGKQALAVEMDMRQGLYRHLVRLSFGFYDRHQTGQLMSRATVDRQRALYVPFISWVPLLAQAAVLLVGARMVANGGLTVGGFIAFNLYLGMLILPLRSLGMWIGQAQRATASGERIFQVMDEPEEIADRPDAVELPNGGGHLSFEGVGFEYIEGRPVLENIDLELAPGKRIALIGHTGSGKATPPSLVPRFY